MYVVSVGVSDYPGVANDLRLPHNDAATVQWIYKENKKAETVLLINSNATRANVMNAISRLFKQAKTNDIVVLFLSGHGVKGGFMCYDGCLNYSYIRNVMASCKSKNKMIMADTCFSGSMRHDGRINYGGLKDANIMLFLSCRDNEYSIETKNMTNGFFTYALQHGLRGGADANKDRIITARELFNYVSVQVKRKSNNKQHPVMWGRFPENMPVIKW